MIGLLIFMRRKLNGIEGKSIWGVALKSSLAAIVMSAALIGWIQLTLNTHSAIRAVGGVVIGLVFYGFVISLLKVPEVRTFIQVIRSRIRL